MEQPLAILMADLSGYSALTETHGATSAADLIDRYVGLVEDSLVGDCKLTERRGDEVMIVAREPDHLLATAVMILKNAAGEDNFLQIHGGLHYGTVLTRNNSYFGSAINLTARITSKAGPGTFWCSGDFLNALVNRTIFNLQAKGKHRFKNISEEIEIVELAGESQAPVFIDPVCRMIIVNKETAVKYPDAEDIFFCSNDCFDIYKSVEFSKSR
jgi:class 3 adenylate cyclase